MRISGLWAICVGATALLLAGCGSGGGTGSGNGGSGALNGVWTGSTVQTRAVGDTSSIQLEFIQNGTTLTGTAAVTDANGPYIGTITGTVQGGTLNATITNVQPSVAGPNAVLQTETQPVMPRIETYSTSKPIDVTKPVVVTLAGQVLASTDYVVNGTATSPSTSISVFVPLTGVGPLEIKYYPADLSPDAGRVATLTGSVKGTSIQGSYTTTASSGNTAGTFTFTKSVGTTTPNLPSRAPNSTWSGTYSLGADLYVCSFTFTQTQNRLTFTGQTKRGGTAGSNIVPNPITGTGAVIGNEVILFLAGDQVTLSGTLNNTNGGTITGTTLFGPYTGPMQLSPQTLTAFARKAR